MSLLPAIAPRPRIAMPLWVLGAGIALVVALGVGDPSADHLALLGAVVGLGVLVASVLAPLAGYLVLVGSCVMLCAVSVGTGERSVLPFDLLLAPLILSAVLARLRRRTPSTPVTATGRIALDRATRRFTDSVWLYVLVAAASLLVTVAMGSPAGAIDSGLKLSRAVQGMLMFGIGMSCIRDERDLGRVVGAMVVGGVALAVVNFSALATLPLTSDNTIRRAGMVWFVNESGWSIGSPNEAGVALLMLWVVLMARQMQRPRVIGWVMMALTLILLILTQSRSALLAWLIFTVMTWKRLPRRALMLGLLGVLLATPVVATIWWERMVRTVSAERGSFEVYTTLVRVYGWYAAGRMFVDHPLVGVGYLGFRHFSDRYNELGLMLGTCENIFLEVATGMGLLGLLVFLRALWRTLALGDAVARQAPAGSLAGTLARLHKPYIIALAISNLTCDNWVGLVGLAQVAVWCALLVRAGQLSLDAPARA